MYKLSIIILALSVFFSLKSLAAEQEHSPYKPPVITLYKQLNFSFGLSIPQSNRPTTALGFEQLHSYNHLKERLEGNENPSENQDIFFSVPNLIQQINALNLEFKLKF